MSSTQVQTPLPWAPYSLTLPSLPMPISPARHRHPAQCPTVIPCRIARATRSESERSRLASLSCWSFSCTAARADFYERLRYCLGLRRNCPHVVMIGQHGRLGTTGAQHGYTATKVDFLPFSVSPYSHFLLSHGFCLADGDLIRRIDGMMTRAQRHLNVSNGGVFDRTWDCISAWSALWYISNGPRRWRVRPVYCCTLHF